MNETKKCALLDKQQSARGMVSNRSRKDTTTILAQFLGIVKRLCLDTAAVAFFLLTAWFLCAGLEGAFCGGAMSPLAGLLLAGVADWLAVECYIAAGGGHHGRE